MDKVNASLAYFYFKYGINSTKGFKITDNFKKAPLKTVDAFCQYVITYSNVPKSLKFDLFRFMKYYLYTDIITFYGNNKTNKINKSIFFDGRNKFKKIYESRYRKWCYINNKKVNLINNELLTLQKMKMNTKKQLSFIEPIKEETKIKISPFIINFINKKNRV